MQARAPAAAAALAAAALLLACSLAPAVQAARWDYFQQQAANGASPAQEVGASKGGAPPLPPAPAPEAPAVHGPRPSSIALPAPAAEAAAPSPPASEVAGGTTKQPAAELSAAGDACACTATGVSGGANTSGMPWQGGLNGCVNGVYQPEYPPALSTSVLPSQMLPACPLLLRSHWVRPVAAAAGQQRVDLLHQRTRAVQPRSNADCGQPAPRLAAKGCTRWLFNAGAAVAAPVWYIVFQLCVVLPC